MRSFHLWALRITGERERALKLCRDTHTPVMHAAPGETAACASCKDVGVDEFGDEAFWALLASRQFRENGFLEEAERALERVPFTTDTIMDLGLRTERIHLAAVGKNFPLFMDRLSLEVKRAGCITEDKLHLLFHVVRNLDGLLPAARGQVQDAAILEKFREILKKTPEELGYHIALGMFLSRTGDTSGEIDELDAASKLFHADATFRHYFVRTAWRILNSLEAEGVP